MRVLNATRSITLKSATPPLLVVLSSFHDDVTEVSFVWLHNEAYVYEHLNSLVLFLTEEA